MSPARKRILFVTMLPPNDSRGGVQQRVSTQYLALRELGDIDSVLLYPRPDEVPPWPADFGRLLRVFPRPPVREQLGRFFESTGSVDAAVFAGAAWVSLPSLHRLPRDCVDGFTRVNPAGYDLVFISRLTSAWGLCWTDPVKTIVDVDDVMSQRFLPKPGISLKSRLVGRLRHRRALAAERRACLQYRMLLVCSDSDRDYLGGHPNVAVLPNCFWPHPDMDRPPLPDPPGSMLMIGGFDYGPNLEGLGWFVTRVLPIIREKSPGATIKVVGYRKPDIKPSWLTNPGVEDLGRVDDIGPVIRECKLEICPLLEGYGTRIKILESLAFGKPVVSTTIGAYGHSMSEAEGLFRADEPESFAARCVELLRDASRRDAAGRAGQTIVKARFSRDVVERTLRELASSVLNAPTS